MFNASARTFAASLAVLGLSAVAASAADLPTHKAPPPAPMMAPAVYNWTGFYIGGQLGGSYGGNTWDAVTPGAVAFDTVGTSFLYGGQVGYNYQIGQFVLGAEGDLSGLAVKADRTCIGALGPVIGSTCQTTQSWLASARGRAGVAVDRMLFYTDGGVAFTDYHFSETTLNVQSWSGGQRTGWTVGLGAEYAITDHVTAGVEYNYYDFGSAIGTGGNNPASVKFSDSENTLVGKLSYKF